MFHMLIRIALVAPAGQSQQRLRSALSRPLTYSVRDFQSMSDVQKNLSHFNFQVLVLRASVFKTEQIAMIQKLQNCFPQVGLVSVSPRIDPQARYALRGFARHAFVDEDLEMHDLDRLISKVTNPSHNVWARMHPRAKREDLAMVVTTDALYQEESLHEARFLNYSRMGARLVVHANENHLGLTTKSRVELRYQSSEDPQRIHRLEARVAWIRKASPVETALAGSKTILGLRFVAEL